MSHHDFAGAPDERMYCLIMAIRPETLPTDPGCVDRDGARARRGERAAARGGADSQGHDLWRAVGEACPCCQGRLHKIGEDINEVLDVILAILRGLRTVRPKYACRGCTDGVVQAKAQPRLIESGMVSTALVAYVVAWKFAWYLPLYRQVQVLAGMGPLDASLVGEARGVVAYKPLRAATAHHPRFAADLLRRDANAGERPWEAPE
jgi:transposase